MATLIAAVNARQLLLDELFIDNAYFAGVDVINIHLNAGDEGVLIEELIKTKNAISARKMRIMGTPHHSRFFHDLVDHAKVKEIGAHLPNMPFGAHSLDLPLHLHSTSHIPLGAVDDTVDELFNGDGLGSIILFHHAGIGCGMSEINIRRVRELRDHFRPLRVGFSCPPISAPIIASSVLYGAEFVEVDLRNTPTYYDDTTKLKDVAQLIRDFEQAMQGEVT